MTDPDARPEGVALRWAHDYLHKAVVRALEEGRPIVLSRGDVQAILHEMTTAQRQMRTLEAENEALREMVQHADSLISWCDARHHNADSDRCDLQVWLAAARRIGSRLSDPEPTP